MTQITTERLILRELQPEDWRVFHPLRSNPIVTRFFDYIQSNDVQETRRWVIETMAAEADPATRNSYNLAVERRSDGLFVGYIGIGGASSTEHGEWNFGYAILPEYWGSGYAAESLRGLIGYVFSEVGVNSIYGSCDRTNHQSARTMEKAGMRYKGDFPEKCDDGSDGEIERVYTITRADWRASLLSAPSTMLPTVKIRPLVKTDAEALAAFYNALSPETIRTFRPLREKTTVEVCERLIADNQIDARRRYDLLAEDSRRIIGWAFLANLQTEQPYLGIVVGEDHQGRGIGKALMERLHDWADEQAIAKIYLMVVKDNDRARRLYEQFGFAVYDEEFDELDQLDYLHMVRSPKGHNGLGV